MLAFPPQDWGMLRPSLDSHQHKTGSATIRTSSSRGRKRRSDIDTTQRVCAVYSHECVCGWLRAPRHGRQNSPLRFFLLSGLTKVDGDVDCFSMTAAVWPLGWTVCNAPLQCLEGNTIWPHARPPQSFEINALCTIIYYPSTIRGGESGVWNHTRGELHAGTLLWGFNRPSWHRLPVLHPFILSSICCDCNYASSLWISYKLFAKSVLEKCHASLSSSCYYYYRTATFPAVQRTILY